MHYNYSLDYTAEAFVVHKDRVLLRFHEKHSKWLGVGGHVDPGETPDQACVREVLEEVGLAVELVDGFTAPLESPESSYSHMPGPMSLNRHEVSSHHDHFTTVYAAIAHSDAIRQPEGPEGDAECRWLSLSEVRSLRGLDSTIAGYAEEALLLVSSLQVQQK